ncbi:MAG: hypothetical protein E7395_03225 [Ruminococcaceae bacterium]|nr:hypothetical protein [Oscillospiraceae bacterium]
MTGEGIVVSVSGTSAKVLIRKKSACSHDCSDCSACTAPTFETTVSNPLEAKVGDRVVIEGNTSKILGVSLLVYILPVFLLIVAAIVCDANSMGAASTALIFAVMLAIWIFVIRLSNKKFHTTNTIVGIIDAENKR